VAGRLPAAPVDASRLSGVECVKNVRGNICESGDVASAARQCHEPCCIVLLLMEEGEQESGVEHQRHHLQNKQGGLGYDCSCREGNCCGGCSLAEGC
jgi:hypothetical protein